MLSIEEKEVFYKRLAKLSMLGTNLITGEYTNFDTGLEEITLTGVVTSTTLVRLPEGIEVLSLRSNSQYTEFITEAPNVETLYLPSSLKRATNSPTLARVFPNLKTIVFTLSGTTSNLIQELFYDNINIYDWKVEKLILTKIGLMPLDELRVGKELDMLFKLSELDTYYSFSEMEELIIPNDLECIEEYSVAYCTKLRKIVIPKTVKRIEARAFYKTPIEHITFEGNLDFIGDYAFSIKDIKTIVVSDSKIVPKLMQNFQYVKDTEIITPLRTIKLIGGIV